MGYKEDTNSVPLRDKKLHAAFKIYYGVYKCGEDYIGETKRNTLNEWSKHDKHIENSEPARHLNKHINHIKHINLEKSMPRL